jgi:2-oxoglutarate dehydrogenase E1 component
MSLLDLFHGPNAGYVAELLERYEREPAALDEATRRELAAWLDGRAAEGPARPPAIPGVEVAGAAAAAELAQHIRLYGHRAAQLDPLGGSPPGDPLLGLEGYGLTETDLARLPASVVGGAAGAAGRNAAEAIAHLRRIYCTTSGYEFAHLQAPAERAWLLDAVEGERYRPPAEPVDERQLLHRLTEVSAFERFIHRAYPGQTRFSIEGLGMMIPMLDELISCAGQDGTRTILLGMAHRGRLNVLAHVLGKPYVRILAEFEGRLPARRGTPSDAPDEGWAGDVKYHAGGRRAYQAENEPGSVTVVLAPNPSHLEFVNPVVEGMARAADEDRRGPGRSRPDEVASLAVLIHGDAAFPAQGVVAETLNLSRLPGYRTGGTLHLIANNQLGFTTTPAEGRSTLYASDLAKGFEIPIVHVNADDPVACLAAVRLAVAYRSRFRKDFLIDLIGYRRWGHNEGDDPSLTQPWTYALIARQPTVRERFAADLVRRGVVAEGEPERLLREGLEEFQRLRESVLEAKGLVVEPLASETPQPTPNGAGAVPAPDGTGVPPEELRALNEALLRFPEGFTLHPKLQRPLQRRRAALEAGASAPIDWGHAETLAFASILRDGRPIRLTGQDAARGTFSQRHLTLHDAETGALYTPLERLPQARASLEVRNSPLSETAALGFEYGYSLQAPDALVLWEAQYGDFVNSAQVIVDEFVASGQAKWGLVSGLVLLLPHGYEGQGPDHSSARLERFLELAAEENIRVVTCTTAGQYFHLLRRQAASLGPGRSARPLVVMTPKSLLRHPLAESPVAELSSGGFRPVLDDARATKPDRVRRLVLCSGKIWVDVESAPARAAGAHRPHPATPRPGGTRHPDGTGPGRVPSRRIGYPAEGRVGVPGSRHPADLAVVRVEELYPFPADELRSVLARYRRAREVVWLQEEPRNMGGWFFVAPRLGELIGDRALRYVGRPEMASPAEGWGHAHAVEQRRIVEAVFEGVASHAG